MKRSGPFLILFFILLLALSVRFYKIDIPLADHHSWRQADTAAVARNFIKENFDFLRPKIDNKTFLHSPKIPNEERLFLVEPPLYQSFIYPFYLFFGVKESLARLVSILFSLGSILFLYFLVKRFLGNPIALLSAFFFAVLPYNIYFSRVILPEPLMIFLALGMLNFFSLWIEKERKLDLLLATLFAALAFTQKAFPLFLGLPMFYLVFRKYSFSFFKQKSLWFFLIVSLSPFLLWRSWANFHPEGVPSFDWLFNELGIRFKGAFFWWIFEERLGKLILGAWGLIPLGLGLILLPGKKEGWFFHFWLGAVLIYTFVFAAGNVTHDYYQIPFIPILCVFLAKGSYFLLFERGHIFHRALSMALFVVCFFFMIFFSWHEVRDFYNIQGGVDLAGKMVDKITPANTLVLTGDSNDATLLYNTNRWGWTGGYASYYPNNPETIEKLKEKGASIYVTTKFNETSDFGRYMLENFKILDRTDQYYIFSLNE